VGGASPDKAAQTFKASLEKAVGGDHVAGS